MGKGASGDVLFLTPEVLDEVIAHCRREAPREACGWIAGVAGEAKPGGAGSASAGVDPASPGLVLRGAKAYPMKNVHSDPVRRYQMDPAEQFAVMGRMRRGGEELVAIYHSHPVTEPVPSKTDIDLAYTKDVVYLIVSLRRETPEWRGWWLDCDTRRCEEVEVWVASRPD